MKRNYSVKDKENSIGKNKLTYKICKLSQGGIKGWDTMSITD